MHIASIEHLEKKYSFWEVFTVIVISCRLNMCKPEPAIYAYLLQTYRLQGSQTVLIDDLEANLIGAALFDIKTIKFETAAQCERELRELACFKTD